MYIYVFIMKEPVRCKTCNTVRKHYHRPGLKEIGGIIFPLFPFSCFSPLCLPKSTFPSPWLLLSVTFYVAAILAWVAPLGSVLIGFACFVVHSCSLAVIHSVLRWCVDLKCCVPDWMVTGRIFNCWVTEDTHVIGFIVRISELLLFSSKVCRLDRSLI